MKIAKKIFYILITILQVCMLIGAYMVNYFTQNKMGMLRHVVHKNYIWENTYPIETIKYTVIISLIVLMIGVLILYLKRKSNLNKLVTVMTIVMVICVLSFTGFTLIYSAEEMRAFYYVSAILCIMTLVQIIKTFIGIIWFKKEK
ncbi:hypothetical protein [Paraclostridium bifermentans]|uniref:hypothetical protein n=1 Tax=Paraclostridium bifermentans TaxID=1490 RepID=UPI00359C4CA3